MSPVSAPAQPCVSSFPARQLGNFVFAFVAADLVAATTTTSNTGVNIQQKMKILIKQSKELKRFKQFELLKQLKKLQQLQQLRQPQKLQQLEQSKQLKQLAPPPPFLGVCACLRVCHCAKDGLICFNCFNCLSCFNSFSCFNRFNCFTRCLLLLLQLQQLKPLKQ